jgi:antitoxin component of MazEF toxin-antitoxin module
MSEEFKLKKNGNAYEITLPKKILDHVGADDDTHIHVELKGNKVTLKPLYPKDFRMLTILMKILKEFQPVLKHLVEGK